jgi:DNA-directed RNA polymerase subunit RPC12/RpoP
MGSELSDTRFNTIIMASLPESYHPTLQMITTAEKANALTGQTTNRMKADNLIAFLIEEAQHCIINVERSKNSEQALAAHAKNKGKGKPRERAKGDDKALSADSDIICHNCKGKRVIAGLKEVVKRVKVHIRERERKPKQWL